MVEPRHIELASRSAAWGAGAALASAWAAILFVSPYLNYGAEGAAVAALARFAGGGDLYPVPPALPLALNQYSPWFYWLAGPLVGVAGGADAAGAAFAGRILMLLCAAGCAGAVLSIARALFGKALPARAAALAAAAAFVSFPANLLAVKPDLPALLLELLALRFALDAADGGPRRAALLAGALAAGAAALKLNSLGALGGVALAFLTLRQGRSLLAFVAGAGSAGAALVASAWSFSGPGLLSNMAASLANEYAREPALIGGIYFRLGWTFLLPLVFLLACAWQGYVALRLASPARARVLGAFLSVSFALALLGQLKFGAYTNYFYGFLAGVSALAAGGEGRARLAVRAGLAAVLAVQAVLALRVPAVILRDRGQARDEAALRAHLDRAVPAGWIYTRDPNTLVRLHDRAVFGPETELLLEHTPALAHRIPEIAARLEGEPIGAVVARGEDCEHWRPSSAFASRLAGFGRLSARFGDLCVLVTGPAAPVQERE